MPLNSPPRLHQSELPSPPPVGVARPTNPTTVKRWEPGTNGGCSHSADPICCGLRWANSWPAWRCCPFCERIRWLVRGRATSRVCVFLHWGHFCPAPTPEEAPKPRPGGKEAGRSHKDRVFPEDGVDIDTTTPPRAPPPRPELVTPHFSVCTSRLPHLQLEDGCLLAFAFAGLYGTDCTAPLWQAGK